MSLPEDPHQIYTGNDPVEDENRGLKHELVRQVKRVVELTALVDITGLEPSELADLADRAGQIADSLEKLPSLSRYGGLATSPPDDSALMERSGITGRSNPLAPPLRLELDGDLTRGHAVYGAPYEGPPGCLHGGFVAAAFDDMMGLAQMASGIAGYTGTLTVRMRRPTPLYERIDYEAGLDRVDGRKIVVWGKSWHQETLLADAEILFITPKSGSIARAQG